MINPNELRIGNILLYHHINEEKEIEPIIYKIDAKDILQLTTDERFKKLHFPVIIGEAIQTSLGFNNHKAITVKDNFYHLYSTVFYSKDFEEQVDAWELSRNNEGLGRLDFVHDLQNLFFDLTKTELIINI